MGTVPSALQHNGCPQEQTPEAGGSNLVMLLESMGRATTAAPRKLGVPKSS